MSEYPKNSAGIDQRELHDKLKITSVAVTHDMVSAFKIGTRIAMMYQGRIIKIGKPAEIRETSDPVIKQFITGSATGPIKDIQFKSLDHAEGGQSE